MNEPSEPVAYDADIERRRTVSQVMALTSRVNRLEARVGAYEAFLDTLASDARFFANAQKKALLEGGSVKP